MPAILKLVEEYLPKFDVPWARSKKNALSEHLVSGMSCRVCDRLRTHCVELALGTPREGSAMSGR